MYIHQHICISAQQTNNGVDLEAIHPSIEGKLKAIESPLQGVPPSMLRRMSKAVRIGIGAGLPLINERNVDGIIIGTANGGMEDCIKFLNQIVEYEEGLLTPVNFVQSTPNAIAGQISLIAKNRAYNATHVHQGLAFENALLDAKMSLAENPGTQYLVGGVDEISSYNYNIDLLAGWYDINKSNQNLYESATPGTIAGEGSAMFLISDNAVGALANIIAIEAFQSDSLEQAQLRFKNFMDSNSISHHGTLLINGENGDSRFTDAYHVGELVLGDEIPVARYKHVSGEYPTASSFALWLACHVLQEQKLPSHFYKGQVSSQPIERVIIYNQYQGRQYSFMLLSK